MKKKICLLIITLLLLLPITAFAAEFKEEDFIGHTICGGIESFQFHERVPQLTSTAYNLLKIAIPIILVIKGMLDMFKSMSSGKEDEMKKSQKKFINRLIAGICAFLVFILVETIIGWISTATNNQGAMDCVNCFINGPEYCQTIDNNTTNNSNSSNVGFFTLPFRQNVSYIVTSEYGQRNGTMHYGIDIEAPMKTSILAVADGVVVDAGRHDSMGNYVIIQHKYNDTNYYTFYMHMSEINVKKFQKVSKGDKIGVIGSTGNSTGIHLHLERFYNI